MNTVWEPSLSPPKLGRFSHLSPDGQALMAAVYRQYYEEREKLSLKKNFLSQVNSSSRISYQKNYKSTVASQLPSFPGQKRTNTIQEKPIASDNTIYNSSFMMSTPRSLTNQGATPTDPLQLLQINDNTSYQSSSSPPMDTQSTDREPLLSLDLSSPETNPNEKNPVPYWMEHDQFEQDDTVRNPDVPQLPSLSVQEDCDMDRSLPEEESVGDTSVELSAVIRNPLHIQSSSVEQRIDEHPYIRMSESDPHLSHLPCPTSTELDFSMVQSLSREVNTGGLSIQRSDRNSNTEHMQSSSRDQILDKDFNFRRTENAPQLPQLPCLTIQNAPQLPQLPCLTIQNAPQLPQLPCLTIQNDTNVIKSIQTLHDNNTGGDSFQQSAVTKNAGQMLSSTIEQRLDKHLNIRKTLDNSKKVFAGNSSNKKKPGRNRSIDQFCVPYKKVKTTALCVSEDPSLNESSKTVTNNDSEMQDAGENHDACTSSNVVNIAKVSEDRREKIFIEILSSAEVLLSLSYANGSTQLREAASGNTKRKGTTAKTRSSEEEAGICLFYKMNRHAKTDWVQNRVIYFPLPFHQSLVPSICGFWENLLASRTKKVCCFAKDFIITLSQRVFVKNCYLYSRVSLMDSDFLDPIVGCWLLDPDNTPSTFSQALQHFHITHKETEVLNAIDVISQDFQHLSILMTFIKEKLTKKGMWNLFYNIETKLIPILAAMETRSIKVDSTTFTSFSEILKKKLTKLERKAHEAAGHAFVINSHAQLRQVLFEELKLDQRLPQKTKFAKTNVGHQMSTSEAVLNQLINVHSLPAVVLEYRQIQKLKSTYVDGMVSCVKDGTISTHWDQTSAATGRLSSYQPNIQAIPKTAVSITECKDNFILGKNMDDTVEILAREPFISKDGWMFLAADFQQIELRLLAHLADDPTLLEIFWRQENKDIFLELTSQWLNKPVSDVTFVEREQTKRVVYSVMYGVGKEKLAEYLKISPENAKGIMQSFLVTFPAVNQFTRKCVEFCQQFGYTETIFHRQRLFPNIRHPSPPLRAQSERQAVNFCVQGSAADLCKSAMLQVERARIRHPELEARLLVQIHDELLLEVAEKDMNEVQNIVKEVMEDRNALCGDTVTLKVPIKVSLSTGRSWGHMVQTDQ